MTPDYRKHPGVNRFHTFDIDPSGCRTFCFDDSALMLWDVRDPDAWLACEDAPLTADYR